MNYFQLRDWKLDFAVGNVADIKNFEDGGILY